MTNNEIIFENVRASFTPAQLAELVNATYTAEQIAARRANVTITVDEGSADTAEDIFTAMLAADNTKFPGGEIVRNTEADRLQIIFDEKPDDEQREALKQNSFRWSPRYGAWQRQLTRNAEIAARRALGLTE